MARCSCAALASLAVAASFMAACLAAPSPPGPAQANAPSPPLFTGPWHDAAALQSELETLVNAHANVARITSYGKSREGRDLWCVELSTLEPAKRARRPALLVVAGLDGNHLVGTEVVLDHLRRLVNDAGSDAAIAKLLADHVVYLIPRANPDGAEAFFRPPGAHGSFQFEARGNLRPLDDDRDGALDEDPPHDLDGNGVITQMRWKDPAGTFVEDPKEPRIVRPAEAMKGERGVYKTAVESLDRDRDGEHGEDGAGDVVPARNYAQRFAEHDPTAGRAPMDEPETLALGQFLFDRPAIALVVVYGLHDNLSVDPKFEQGGGDAASGGGREGGGGGGGPGGGGPGGGGGGGGGGFFRGPRTMPTAILRDDQPLYGELATRYREATGVTSKPLVETDDGAFWTFSYFQFGVPTLAMHLWSPPLDVKAPEAAKEEGKEEGKEGPEGKDAKPEEKAGEEKDKKPGEGQEAPPAATPPSQPPPTSQPQAGADPQSGGPGGGGRRGRGGGSREGAGAGAQEGGAGAAKKADPDEPKLLLWNDHALAGSAFVPWTKVQHPTLGEVEVGGWKPYVRTNPPADALPELARKHTDFLLKLGALLPSLRVGDVKVEDLGGGLFRVTAAVVNEGFLPTVCSMGERSRRPKPTRLDLDLGDAKLIQGEARHTWQRIEGSGGRREVKWIVQGTAGTKVTLKLWSEKGGDDERVVELAESAR